MDAIFDRYEGQVAPVRYHVNWPNSGDPFYLYNWSEVNTRKNYYLVNYVPTFRFDGKYLGDPSDFGTYAQWYNFVRSTFDSLLTVPSKIRINMEQTRETDSVHVSFDVVVVDSMSASFNIFLAVTEDTAMIGYYPFENVFRDMVPDAAGYAATLNTGDSLHFDWAYRLVASSNAEDLITTIFVQKPGSKKVMQTLSAKVPTVSTDVAAADVPLRIVLDQNTPNPFNPRTKIHYALDEARPVRLSVFDMAGRLVAELESGVAAEGAHSAIWNGLDRSGRPAGSGVYFYRLDTQGASFTRKMLLVR